jgi:hypothetical protein
VLILSHQPSARSIQSFCNSTLRFSSTIESRPLVHGAAIPRERAAWEQTQSKMAQSLHRLSRIRNPPLTFFTFPEPELQRSFVSLTRRYVALVEMAAAAASKGRQVSLLVSIIEHALEIIYKHFQDSKAGSSEPHVREEGSMCGCKRSLTDRPFWMKFVEMVQFCVPAYKRFLVLLCRSFLPRADTFKQ